MSQYASIVKLDYDPNVEAYTSLSQRQASSPVGSYSSDSDKGNPFVRRIDCWQDTRRLCEELPLRPPPSIKVTDWDTYRMHEFVKQIERRKQNVSHWGNLSKSTRHSDFSLDQWSPREPTVDFLNQDAIDVALDLLSTGKALRPLVLNLADDLFAGGCVNQGSGAQEESLFRRTNYFQTLEQDDALYPIEDGEAVYSPEVTILKSSEETGWQLYPVDQRPVLAFVACPGLKYPEWIVGENGEYQLTSEDVQILKEKIGVIIQVAVQYKHDAIVMGALGCGAWRNPIKHVAEIFKSVLDAYEGLVPYVVFAILSTTDDHYNIVRSRENHSKKSTCEIFQDVFGQLDT